MWRWNLYKHDRNNNKDERRSETDWSLPACPQTPAYLTPLLQIQHMRWLAFWLVLFHNCFSRPEERMGLSESHKPTQSELYLNDIACGKNKWQ